MQTLLPTGTLKKTKEWFTDYTDSFSSNDPDIQQNIDLKKDHTLRVCGEILYIGESLGLKDDELNLAEIIALFHDIGRFEQYTRYKTFVDKKSENHAELGISVLNSSGILKNFDSTAVELITKAVKYHNLASLPEDESETCLFYSRLIRDADKIDIWKVVIDYYNRTDTRRNTAIELDLPDSPGFSEEVYSDLANRRIVSINHIKNLNDFKLLQVGWIFDINFQPTFKRIKERGYLDSIKKVLPDSKEINNIFNIIYSMENVVQRS
ncbi:MAG: HD domain-containing protein [Spirochaetes bacterium]|nr:HD domain-containing protein [Spirochaetota bacterium]